MAIGSGVSIGATDIALRADDRPIFMGRNWLRESTSVTPQWRSGGSWASGSDETDSNGPTSYLFDEFDHHQSYPDSNLTTWYLIFDLGADVGVIDSVAILNHNFGSSCAQIALELADDNAFGVNLKICEAQTPTDNKRLVFLDLDDTAGGGQLRYSNVRYLRLKLDPCTAVPKIGEVIFSRRRQLKNKSVLSFDPYNLRSKVEPFKTDSGVSVRYVRNKGQRVLTANFNPSQDAYIGDIETLFDTDTDFGTNPFLYIENPGTSPSDALWMEFDNPELIGPLSGWTERNFSLRATELGPNFLALGA